MHPYLDYQAPTITAGGGTAWRWLRMFPAAGGDAVGYSQVPVGSCTVLEQVSRIVEKDKLMPNDYFIVWRACVNDEPQRSALIRAQLAMRPLEVIAIEGGNNE